MEDNELEDQETNKEDLEDEDLDLEDEDEDEDEDEEVDAEELFRENPLKAIWIKLNNIEETLTEKIDNLEQALMDAGQEEPGEEND